MWRGVCINKAYNNLYKSNIIWYTNKYIGKKYFKMCCFTLNYNRCMYLQHFPQCFSKCPLLSESNCCLKWQWLCLMTKYEEPGTSKPFSYLSTSSSQSIQPHKWSQDWDYRRRIPSNKSSEQLVRLCGIHIKQATDRYLSYNILICNVINFAGEAILSCPGA